MALIDNLVAYWKLDESSGNSADSVGSSTLSLVGGGSSYGSAKINNGFNQNGYTNYSKFLGAIGSIDGGPISISMWVKDVATRSAGSDYGFCSYVNTGTKTRYGIMKSGASGELTFSRDCVGGGGTSGQVKVAYSTYINTSNYVHLVLTYDGTNVRGYVNGSQVGTAQPASGNGVGYAGSVTGFGLGAFQGWDGFKTDYTADAKYDEVGIWNRAITDTEIAQLNNGGAGLPYPLKVGSSAFFQFF